MATLAGGASDFFQAVAGYKAPSVRCLQLQVLGSTVLFCFLPSVVILIRSATDFEGVYLNRARLRKRITVAIFNVGETPSRRANLRVFHNRLKNKNINTIIILIIIEIKNTLIN